MVAGCRLWSADQQQGTQHHPGDRGQLAVEAVLEDRARSGEAGGLRALVEAGRAVDQEDHREADQAKDEDTAAEVASARAHRHRGERGGKRRNREQQIGVSLACGFRPDRGGRRRRQARIAGLADLDAAVVDELRGRQTAR
jgi:hypothetical protein